MDLFTSQVTRSPAVAEIADRISCLFIHLCCTMLQYGYKQLSAIAMVSTLSMAIPNVKIWG